MSFTFPPIWITKRFKKIKIKNPYSLGMFSRLTPLYICAICVYVQVVHAEIFIQ